MLASSRGRRVAAIGRAALSVALAVAIVPLPIGSGFSPERADAATIQAPYASILGFPENPHSVSAPGGVAVASDGTMFIADTGNDRIRVLTAAGALVASWGIPGTAPGQMSGPEALALGSDGRVYVADTGNSRVEVFERDGTFVRAFGSLGAGDGQLNRPSGIAVDAQGRVFVSDTGNARIERFSPTGVFAEKWGSKGVNPDQFDSPRGIAVDASGYVYVVDTNKSYVKKFSPSHVWVLNWGFLAGDSGPMRYQNPTGLTLTPDGLNLMVADTGNCRIERCDLNGAVLESVGAPPWSRAVGSFRSPVSAVRESDRSWVVADTGNDRIQIRNSSGVWQTPWETSSSSTGLLSAPQAVASNASGSVYYVADTANSRVLRFGNEGAYLGSIAETGSGNGQVRAPAGLLVLADGSVLVADTGNNRIEKFDSAGVFAGTIGTGILSAPRGLAVSDTNVLFVADTGNNRIATFDLDNANAFGFIGSLGSGPGQFNAPRGLAVNRNELWVADTGNNRIQKFNANTRGFSLSVGGFGTAAGQMSVPLSVAMDGSDVIVADTGNNRIQRFDASGLFVTSYDGTVSDSRGRMHAPACVALAPGGRTLVAERDGARIRVLVAETAPPITTISGVPAAPARSATFSLSATDSTAGVAATYYRIGSVTTSGTGPVTVSTEGEYTVAYWSVDRAGNAEPEQSASFVIDRTPPTGGFSAAGGQPWVATSTVSVASSILGANEMRIGYDSNPGAWVPYADTTTVVLPDSDGRYTVSAEYRDQAGNVSSFLQLLTLDRVGPAVSGLTSPTHPLGTPSFGAPSLTWDASSDLSGVNGYSVSIDREPASTPPRIVNAPTSVFQGQALAAGEWFVHVAARDNAGNWGPPSHVAIQVLVDLTPPVTTRSDVPSVPVNTDVTLMLSAGDDLSGVAATWYRIGGGAARRYTAPIVTSAEGATTITFWSVDNRGNLEPEQSVSFTIDRTPPQGDFSLPSVASSNTVVIASDVAGATDMRVNGGEGFSEWVPYAASCPVTLPLTEGLHEVAVEYRDGAGNIAPRARSVLLDFTAPQITGLSSPTHPLGIWVYGTPTVMWGSVSDASGVVGYSYVVDGTPDTVAPATVNSTVASVTLPGLGWATWYVHVRALDAAGNWGPTAHLPVQVLGDLTPPFTTASGLPSGPTSQTVVVSLSGADEVSGLGSLWYRIGAGPAVRYVSPFAIPWEGVTSIEYWAVDVAGNVEPTHAVNVIIDRTPPDGDFVAAAGVSAVTSPVVRLDANVLGATEMRTGYGSELGPWSPFDSITQVSLPDVEGFYTVVAEYRDEAGNVLRREHDIVLDESAPTVSHLVSTSHPAGVPTYGSALAEWSGTDEFSGVQGYAVSIDRDPNGVPARVISTPRTGYDFGFLGGGIWYAHVQAVDGVGNWSAVQTVRIDNIADVTAPVTTAVGLPLPNVNHDVTVSLNAADDLSGVSAVRYRLDSGDEVDYSGPITIVSEGAHTLTWHAVDAAGNEETPVSADFVIDRTSPVTTIHGIPSGVGVAPASITLSAVDGLSGVAQTWYRLGTGSARLYSGAIVVGQVGTTVIHYWSVDRAGEVESEKSATLALKSGATGAFAGTSVPRMTLSSRTVYVSRFVCTGSIATKAAGGRIRIIGDRYEGGRWVPRVTSASYAVAIPASGVTFARYSAPVSLGRGTWRVRVSFAGNRSFSAAVSVPSARFVVR